MKYLVFCSFLVLSSCVIESSETVANKTATTGMHSECWGGIRSSISADANAKLGKTLEEGGSIEVGLKNEIVGAIIGEFKVSEERAVALFQAALACEAREDQVSLNMKEDQRQEFMAIKAAQAKLVIAELREGNYEQDALEFEETFEKYVESYNNHQIMLADSYRVRLNGIVRKVAVDLASRHTLNTPKLEFGTTLPNKHDHIRNAVDGEIRASEEEQSIMRSARLVHLMKLPPLAEDEIYFQIRLNAAAMKNNVTPEHMGEISNRLTQ